MLRKLRIFIALIFYIGITLLFLDFTGALHLWLGWMPKVQFLPAVLALNVGVVVLIVVLTLLFGRIYCSMICPLGIMQDFISHLSAQRRRKKHRFHFEKERKVLRYGVFSVFVVLMVIGCGSIASLIAPYSSYGRMVSSILTPLYRLGNNVLAYGAECMDSYTFYSVEVWLKSGLVLGVSILMFLVVAILAWRKGRIYCNTICPVGTFLGFISRYAIFRPHINTSKCNSCTYCSRNCKSECIDIAHHTIDLSRCVGCMDCVGNCHQGAISYTWRRNEKPKEEVKREPSKSRRKFIFLTGLAILTGANAQAKRVLAPLKERREVERQVKPTPAGSLSIKNLQSHCTSCQLCISQCPNDVLRPSGNIFTLLQPEMHYDKGFCRPECTICSEVCPTGAIRPISRDEKAFTQIGHAVWTRETCLRTTAHEDCHSCEMHCPAGAITLVEDAKEGIKVPSVDETRCIGCGACEYLCPARPLAAIHVEGHTKHRNL